MPVMLGLAGGGALLNTISQQQQYAQQKANAATTQRYSPWTGMKADTPTQPTWISGAMQGAGTGAMLGSGIENAQANTNLMNSMANNPNGVYGMGSGGPGGSGAAMSSYNNANGLGSAGGSGPLSGYNYNQNIWGQMPTSTGLGSGY